MNKTMIVAGVVIFTIVSWLTTFVNEIHEDVDVSYGFHEKELIAGEESNYIVDVNGKKVLQLQTLSMQEKKSLWNKSTLKNEILELFPDFTEIKYLINNQIEDDDGLFKQELLNHIDSVQEEYIGGSLSEEQVKERLLKF